MTRQFDPSLFERVFSDAHVVDMDFSEWDKHITLCVVADHIEWPSALRRPLVLVRFVRVRRFHLKFNHYEVQLDTEDQHFQWNIDDFTVECTGDILGVSLFGGHTWPRLEIECQDIEIRRIDNGVVDQLFPGWGKPYSGLMRPAIEEVARRRGLEL